MKTKDGCKSRRIHLGTVPPNKRSGGKNLGTYALLSTRRKIMYV